MAGGGGKKWRVLGLVGALGMQHAARAQWLCCLLREWGGRHCEVWKHKKEIHRKTCPPPPPRRGITAPATSGPLQNKEINETNPNSYTKQLVIRIDEVYKGRCPCASACQDTSRGPKSTQIHPLPDQAVSPKGTFSRTWTKN